MVYSIIQTYLLGHAENRVNKSVMPISPITLRENATGKQIVYVFKIWLITKPKCFKENHINLKLGYYILNSHMFSWWYLFQKEHNIPEKTVSKPSVLKLIATPSMRKYTLITLTSW